MLTDEAFLHTLDPDQPLLAASKGLAGVPISSIEAVAMSPSRVLGTNVPKQISLMNFYL
jgi:hypothetical protein